MLALGWLARRSSLRARSAGRLHSHLRRRWGCETALQGARLKFACAYVVSGDDDGAPRAGVPPDLPSFDPGRDMPTTSLPPPRRCFTECLLYSGTRRLYICLTAVCHVPRTMRVPVYCPAVRYPPSSKTRGGTGRTTGSSHFKRAGGGSVRERPAAGIYADHRFAGPQRVG